MDPPCAIVRQGQVDHLGELGCEDRINALWARQCYQPWAYSSCSLGCQIGRPHVLSRSRNHKGMAEDALVSVKRSLR